MKYEQKAFSVGAVRGRDDYTANRATYRDARRVDLFGRRIGYCITRALAVHDATGQILFAFKPSAARLRRDGWTEFGGRRPWVAFTTEAERELAVLKYEQRAQRYFKRYGRAET